jgi:GNAT superfamily N-acetyltransferase
VVIFAAADPSRRRPALIDDHARGAPVTFRAAEDADRPFLLSLFAAARRDQLAPLGWNDQAITAFLLTQFEAEERDWRRQRQDAQTLLVLRDGEPVGRLSVARSQHEIQVMDLTLAPECRGHGVGTAIFESLIDEARCSRRTVRLRVERTSRAFALLRRLGFLQAATRGGTYLMEWTAEAVG